MPVIGVIFIIMSAILTGTLITFILRERDADLIAVTATGFLSLFAFLLLAVLVSLKANLSLHQLSVLYIGIVSFASVISVPVILKKGTDICKLPDVSGWVKQSKTTGIIAVIAIAFVGVISFAVLSQSVINDDTLEIAYTSAATNTIYEYASLTGEHMINGLPIFNKAYVIPLFYGIMYHTFNISPVLLTLFVLPIVVYAININLVIKVATRINAERVERFLLIYLVLLVTGTYLPKTGIPATTGYALLRYGYSGYAIVFGIVIPLIVLSVLRKNPFSVAIYVMLAVPLVRLDRVFYGLTDFANSYRQINIAGKQTGIFIITVLIAWGMCLKKSDMINWWTIISPVLFVTYVVDSVLELIKTKKERIIIIVGFLLTSLAAVDFRPYSGAISLADFVTTRQEVIRCIESLDTDSSPKIYASDDFMKYARMSDYNIPVLYGRDNDNPYMQGLDYEQKSELIPDYRIEYLNIVNEFDYLVTHNSKEVILDGVVADGATIIIFPETFNEEYISNLLNEKGYFYKGLKGRYKVFALQVRSMNEER